MRDSRQAAASISTTLVLTNPVSKTRSFKLSAFIRHLRRLDGFRAFPLVFIYVCIYRQVRTDFLYYTTDRELPVVLQRQPCFFSFTLFRSCDLCTTMLYIKQQNRSIGRSSQSLLYGMKSVIIGQCCQVGSFFRACAQNVALDNIFDSSIRKIFYVHVT